MYRTVVNVQTGEVTIVPLTPQEVAEIKKQEEAAQQQPSEE
jgi:hypothetical protein